MVDRKEIRKLKAEEIECRVGTINKDGLSLLLYKDARVDMKILDEIYGVNGWQRTHQMIGDRLYCTIEIWDDDKKCWVKKQDVGTESNTEKEKGQASDSFKRAGFNVGIGRELYSAPFIWINSSKVEIKQNPVTNKWVTKARFEVKEIGYDENGDINKLTITSDGKEVYTLGKKSAPKGNSVDFDAFREKIEGYDVDKLRVEYATIVKSAEYTTAQKNGLLKIIQEKQSKLAN